MKSKALNLALIITSLLGYLEWGTDSKMFLFQGEAEIVSKLFKDPQSVIHPFILLPLFGQMILLLTLFQKQSSKLLTHIGLWSIALLLLFMLVIGIISMNLKITGSTIPFIVTGIMTVIHYRKRSTKTHPSLS